MTLAGKRRSQFLGKRGLSVGRLEGKGLQRMGDAPFYQRKYVSLKKYKKDFAVGISALKNLFSDVFSSASIVLSKAKLCVYVPFCFMNFI